MVGRRAAASGQRSALTLPAGATNDRRIAKRAETSRLRRTKLVQMKTDGVRVLKSVASSPATFRDRAIVHYHDLLAADKTLSTTVLEKLRASMRVGRLTYGEPPLG